VAAKQILVNPNKKKLLCRKQSLMNVSGLIKSSTVVR
jgi:hypothetical protein